MKNGWKQHTFGELGPVFNGNSISENEKKTYFEGLTEGVPYIGTKDVGFDYKIDYESGVKIPDNVRDRFKLAPKNTVLVCAEGGSAGRKIAYTDRDVYFGNKLFAICPKLHDCSRFIFYYCLSDTFAKQFKDAMAGLIGGVSLSKFKDLSILLPPLPEQQRIVRILDEAFESIAAAKAYAERNSQNARDLFESYLNGVFSNKGNRWIEKPLGELATFRNGVNFTKSSCGQSVKIVGVKNFQQAFWIPSVDELESVTTDGMLQESDTLKENDLLFVRSNGSIELIGRSLLVGKIDDKITHSGFTIRARLNSKDVVSRYLCHFLKSSSARQEMINGGIGTNIKSLNQATLSALVVPLPSTAEQMRIADQIEDIEVNIKRLESIYQRKLTALEALKRSLLHQAFTGNL